MKGKLSAFCWQFFCINFQRPREAGESDWGVPVVKPGSQGDLSWCLKEYLYGETEIPSHWKGEKSTVILKKRNTVPETRRSSFWKYNASYHRRVGEASGWGQSRWTKPEPGRPHRARSSSFPISGWSWGFCHVNVRASMGHWSLLGASAQLDLKWLEGRDPKREATSGLISCSQFSEKKNSQSALCLPSPFYLRRNRITTQRCKENGNIPASEGCLPSSEAHELWPEHADLTSDGIYH